ncbi:MAG: hypothetical protein ABIQ01_07020 [Pseudolysinimonas sp.]
MRRRLAIVGICAAVVVAIAVSVLLFIGSPVADSVVFSVALGAAILAFVIGVMAAVFGIILPIFGSPASFMRQPAVAEAVAAGRSGLARVLSVRPTGAQINGQWVYDADLVVDGTQVPTYRARDRIRVHRNDGTLHGGEILSVVRIAQDGPAVTVIAGPAHTPQDALVPQDAPPWS